MGLSFLTPALLGGAALVAAPILLHLVMRRRPVPHDFPALRFLRERAVANRRRLRLSHLLLLLLRVAALLLVALALARPVLRGAGWLPQGEGPVAAAFVFDTAPRMAIREGNVTRLERAAALARVLFDKLPSGSEVAVLDTGDGQAAFSPTPAAAEVRIDRLEPAMPAGPLPAAVAAARRLLETSELERRELYVFTDCSHGAWDAAPAVTEEEDGLSVLYVDVAATAPDNFAIRSLDLSGERVPAGTPLVVTATVDRSGPAAERQVGVEILGGDGAYVRRGVIPAACEADKPATVAFEIGGLEPGMRQGRVVLDGGDALAADDVRSFTVEVGPPVRVIVAAPRPAERTAALMVQALAPAALRRAGTARFEPDVVEIGELGGASWDAARDIVLLDPPPLPEREWEALAEWVAAGHGLVAWLGPAAGGPAAFNSAGSRRVLGGDIVRVWRTPGADNFLAPAALDHPIMAPFRRVGDAVPWQDYPVMRHWEFAPLAAAEGDEPGGATVVAAYRNGLPAVLVHRLGQGTVVVVTTPVSQAADDPAAWNQLATGFEPWPFVVLANETVLHAAETVAARNVVAGAAARLPLGRRDLPTVLVRTPRGDEFPVAVDAVRGTVAVTATWEPGNYAVRAGGRVGGVADGFSVNLGDAAVDFRRVPEADLAALFGPGHRLARTEEELVRDVNLERIGTELFGWTILLAAIAMAADWIVANRFYAPREPEADQAGAAAGFIPAEAADLAAEGDGQPPAEESPPPATSPAPPPRRRRRGPPPLPEAAEKSP